MRTSHILKYGRPLLAPCKSCVLVNKKHQFTALWDPVKYMI